ncbi:MAG TPA: nuclear transport factor 2 family protein [Thermoanaerobaculia bacterium]|jgi:hypothetical protein|nr:nuclear transport factor 2 family protein [Thermoanaerobaculia bacterium]
MSLNESVRALNELILQKQLVHGIDRFYADDVVMIEGGGETMAGKDANRERERAFEGGLTRWEPKLVASAVDETSGTALNEWILDYSHEQWGSAQMRQVAVQKWRDGRIVHESFYKL